MGRGRGVGARLGSVAAGFYEVVNDFVGEDGVFII
jgi:hypothetical protein